MMVTKVLLLSLVALLGGIFPGVQTQTECNIEVTDGNGYEVSSGSVHSINGLVGLSYTLTCSCQSVNQTVTYQWKKNDTLLIGPEVAQSTLMLSQLRLSDAGRYTCSITLNSVEYSSNVDVTIQIPAPSYVIIGSGKPSPIRPIGSNVTVTCTVGLQHSTVGATVPLMVTIHLSNPAGMVLNTTMDSVSGSTYTSRATISSFERAQSGVYSCEAILTSPSSYLSESSTVTEEINLSSGVYLSLGGAIENNTCASIGDIGSSIPNQLACVTDKMPCCQTEGQWYYPNGSQVRHSSGRNRFYVERTNEGSANLLRHNNVLEPYGEFCCKIADAADVNHTLCIDLVPSLSIQIVDNGTTPVAGLNYSLSCKLSGIDSSITSMTYEWRKDGSLLSEMGTLLSFSPLRLSDAGQYSCTVSMYECPFKSLKNLSIIEVMSPVVSVSIVSDPMSPLGRSGSKVHVICTAELSPVVDIPVAVQIQLTDPARGLLATETFTSNSNSSYTNRALISSFRNDHAGIYTCTVTLTTPVLRGSITTSDMIHIYIGVYILFQGKAYGNNSLFFISEIGRTSSSNALQCVSDRERCCLSGPDRFGQWYFPDGAQIPRESDATVFYRNRGDDGTVNLNRVNSNIMSPTGRYCCQVPDANTVTQTLYAYIVAVQISEEVAPQIGTSNYTLTCILSGAKSLFTNMTYQWFKDIDSSRTQVGSNASVISFSEPLMPSNAGHYTCEVSVVRVSKSSSVVVRNEASWDVRVRIPPLTELNMTSNPQSPIQPIGVSVSLNCSCDIGPSVPAEYIGILDITVSISLRDPTGRLLLTTTAPSVNGSVYTASTVISSFGRDQSGVYTCTASVSSSASYIIGTETSTRKRVTTGVYLSLGGSIIPPHGVMILVTNIGTSSNQLVCTSDRKPCCQDQPQIGGWYFPNQSRVLHLSEQPTPTAFHSDRNNRGGISLYRTSSDIVSPIGQFCCETMDATSSNHTLCVNVSAPIIANITSEGVPTVGQDYTLVCNILSGLEGLNAAISYQWTKDNGTRTQIGTNSSILSFPILRLSDAGSFTCEITVNSSHLLKHATVGTTIHFEVLITQPSIDLISNAPNPILSGSFPILLCIVELHPAVDVPVDINIMWTSPHGLIVMSNLIMKSFSLYTSKVVLSDIGLTDAGLYTCKVNIGNDISASVKKDIQIGDGMFQLRLKYTDDCRMWYKSSSGEMELYKYYIEEALIEAVKLRCECYFPGENLLQESFSCSSSPHVTTYRNTLIGTHNVNASQLVGFIQDWVNSGPKVAIKNSYSVWVDKKCPVAVSSFDEPECGEE